MCHLSSEFFKNRLSSFSVILLTNKKKLTTADEKTASLAEVICTDLRLCTVGKIVAIGLNVTVLA